MSSFSLYSRRVDLVSVASQVDHLYLDTSTTSNYGQEVRGRVISDGAGTALFVARGMFDAPSTFVKTTNNFDTISSETDGDNVNIGASAMPKDADSYVTNLAYLDGYFYMDCIDLTVGRTKYLFRSSDLATWTEISADGGGADQDLEGYGLTLAEDGTRLFTAGRDFGSNEILGAIATGSPVGSFSGYASNLPAGATSYDAVKWNGSWLVRINVGSTDATRYYSVYAQDATTVTSYNDWAVGAGDARPWAKIEDSDGTRAYVTGLSGNATVHTVRYFDTDLDLSVDNLKSHTLTWPRSCVRPKMAYSSSLGIWIAVTTAEDQTDTGYDTTDRLYVQYSSDGGANWSSVYSIRIETAWQSTYAWIVDQIHYAGNGYWMLACDSRDLAGGVGTYVNRPLLLGMRFDPT